MRPGWRAGAVENAGDVGGGIDDLEDAHAAAALATEGDGDGEHAGEEPWAAPLRQAASAGARSRSSSWATAAVALWTCASRAVIRPGVGVGTGRK